MVQLLQKQHYKPTLKLGLPIILGQLGVILLGFVDNIMISRHALVELAAASFVNNFLNLVIILGLGFSYGLTPLIAEAFHRNKPQQMSDWFRHSLFLNMFLALLLGGIAWFLQYHLYFFNVDQDLLPVLIPYYRIQVWGFVVSMLFNTAKQFLEGTGNTTFPMYATLLGNVINILLNWLFIYGNWIFPEWGLYGAGVATIWGRIAMVVVTSGFLIGSPQYCSVVRGAFFSIRIQMKKVLSLLRLSIPVSLQMGMEAVSFSIAVVFVAKFGNQSLAAHQIVSIITTLGYLIYYGLGAATAIRVSVFRSQGNLKEARNAASASFQLALFSGGCMVIGILLFNQEISALFKADQYVTRLVSYALIPVYLFQVGDALQVIYANALRGMAQVRYLVPIAALCHVVIAPLLCFIFGFVLVDERFQLTAIWFSFLFSLTSLGLLLYRYFKRVTPVR